jgi:hypothetical protein
MDALSCDQLTRQLLGAGTRRAIVGRIAALSLAGPLGLLAAHDDADAKKKRKRKQKKRKQKAAAPNAFGCIDVGALCQNDDQCCSGICAGKQGKKRCRAHDVGDCQAGTAPEACDENVPCTTGAGDPGTCGTTTGNAVYCFVAGGCFACQNDGDCQRADGGALGPRAACVTCEGCMATGGTACVTAGFPEA